MSCDNLISFDLMKMKLSRLKNRKGFDYLFIYSLLSTIVFDRIGKD
jgi:hypothetical protein